MPILAALKLATLMSHRVWGAKVHRHRRLVVIARMHYPTEALVDRMLLAATLKTVTKKVGVFLMRLIS